MYIYQQVVSTNDREFGLLLCFFRPGINETEAAMRGLRFKRFVLAMIAVVSVGGGLTVPSADVEAIPTVLSSPEGERRGEVA